MGQYQTIWDWVLQQQEMTEVMVMTVGILKYIHSICTKFQSGHHCRRINNHFSNRPEACSATQAKH